MYCLVFMAPAKHFPTFQLQHFNCLTLNMNVEVLRSLVSVNGHIMGGQIGLVYVTPHLLDENTLHSVTLRLAVDAAVLTLHDFWLASLTCKFRFICPPTIL